MSVTATVHSPVEPVLKKRFSLIGLDLGSKLIKVVQFSNRKGIITPYCLKLFPTPSHTLCDGFIVDHEKLSATLNKILNKYPWKGKKVNLTLGAKAFYTKPIYLPPMKQKDTIKALKWQIENHFPLKASEVTFDYHYINTEHENNDGKANILLTATKKETVNSYMNLISKAGFIPAGIEISPLTLLRSALANRELRASKTNSIQVILDIGYSYSTIVLTSHLNYRYSRILKFGIADFCRAASHKTNLSSIESEKFIYSQEDLSVKRIFKKAEVFAYQVRESLVYGLSHTCKPVEKLDTIWLSGGGSYIPNLANHLQNRLALKIMPLRTVVKSGHNTGDLSSFYKDRSLLYNTANGLAFRRWV